MLLIFILCTQYKTTHDEINVCMCVFKNIVNNTLIKNT